MLKVDLKEGVMEEAVTDEGTRKNNLVIPLGAAMKKMANDLIRSLPVVASTTNDEKKIVEAAAQSVERAQTFFRRFRRVVVRCIHANIEVVLGPGAVFTEEELRKEEGMKLMQSFPKIEIPVPDVLDWNTIALPSDEMKELISTKLKRWIAEGFVQMEEALLKLKELNFFGGAEVHPDNPKVTRYYFFRHIIRHSKTGVKQDLSTPGTVTEKVVRQEDKPFTPGRSWRNVKTTLTRIPTKIGFVLARGRARHEHHTYRTKKHATPAATVPQPQWITDVIESIRDEVLRDNIFVLAGEMAREEIKEVDVSEKHWTARGQKEQVREEIVDQGPLMSPCILIGDLVLCGWSQRDLPEDVANEAPSGLFTTLENLFKYL